MITFRLERCHSRLQTRDINYFDRLYTPVLVWHRIVRGKIMGSLPDHDNSKIEEIPRTPKVSRRVLPEAISYDFHDALSGKND